MAGEVDPSVWAAFGAEPPKPSGGDADAWRAFGMEPPPPPEDKPFLDDAKEVLRQVGGGFAVDVPRMAGQAAQAVSMSPFVTEMGKDWVRSADERAPEWVPDMEGRGPVAETLIQGGRSVGPSVAPLAAYALGPVAGGAATVGLFGGSQYQETYDKAKAAGATDDEAVRTALLAGGIQGGGEAIANRFTLGMFGIGKKLLTKKVGDLIAGTVDSSVLKPWLKSTGAALIGEPVTEVAQDVGTAAVERQAGIKTEDPWEIAKQSAKGAVGLTLLLSPLGLSGHYKNAAQAKAVDAALSSPEADPETRLEVVNAIHREAKGLGIKEADQWREQAVQDVLSAQPVRRDVQTDPIDAAIDDANAIVDSAQTDPMVDPFAEQLAQQNAARQAEIDAAMPDQGPTIQINPRARAEVYPTGPVRVPWADFEPVSETTSTPPRTPPAAPVSVQPGIPTIESINRAVGGMEPVQSRIREVSQTFPVQENPSGSIVVGGDPKALRETLAAAGIQTKGVTSKNGTTFPVKHAAAVRAALEKSNATPIPTAEGRTPGAGEATGVQSQPSPDAPVTEAPAPIPDAGEFGADRTDVAALAQAAQPDVGYQQVAQGAPAILGEVSFDRRQAQEPIATEQRQGERRANFAERKRVDSLSLEEARRELLTSEKAGLSNERAYNESQRRRKQAFFDLDNFKALNTKYSYAGGDQLINVVGQIMAEEAGDTVPYHIHGDEFLAEHDDEKALDDFAKRVQDRLAQIDVVVTHEDGTVHTKKGVLTSYGIGDTKADAEAALKRDKAQRAAAGLRTERGRDDGGMAPSPAEGREGGVPGAAQEVTAKPSPSDDRKAAAILDAANVRGDSRLNALEKFKNGTFTLKELEDAFPPGKQPSSSQSVVSQKETSENAAVDEMPINESRGRINFAFAGLRTETADTMALEIAKARLAAGEDAETVRQETGWFKGVDGKWRFEIDDSEARIADWLAEQSVERNKGDVVEKEAPLGAILRHPKLFAAYPSLRAIPVRYRLDDRVPREKPSAGAYSQAEGKITVEGSTTGDLMDVLLHEIQHAIQSREGFARGGNARTIKAAMESEEGAQFQRADIEYRAAGKEVPDVFMAHQEMESLRNDLKETHGIRLFDDDMNYRKQSDRELIKVLKEEDRAALAEKQAAYNKAVESSGGWDDPNVRRFIDASIARWNALPQGVSDAMAERSYMRRAGEVEARNVQRRAMMNESDRRAKNPSKTADIPDAEVIVVFNGEDVSNAPVPANAARANPRRLADEEIYRSDSPIKVGMPTVEVERVAANVALSWGENAREVIVHESLADAPQWMRDQVPPGDERTIQGFHDPTTGNVHLIAENLPNKSDVHRILGHEMAGHSAMEEVVNKGEVIKGGWTAVERRIDWLVKAGNKQARSLRDEVQRRGYNMTDRATVTKEMLAVAVERHITDGPIGQILRQLRAAIRNLLRKAGINSLMPDADIDALVVRSLRFLKESGGRSKAVTEALEHPQLGEIDVALGKGRMGASKFATENPEVAANLEDLVAGAKLVEETATRATLQNGDTTFDLVKKSGRWVLTDARVDFARSSGRPDNGQMTDTEEFRNWFRGSKVVDENGDPLIVYHGTRADFDVFSDSESRDGGFHFGEKGQASAREDGRLIPAFLSISDPMRTQDESGARGWEKQIRKAKRLGNDGIVYLNRYEGIPSEAREMAIQEIARDRNTSPDYVNLNELTDEEFKLRIPEARDSYIAFRPEQIKSTIGNRGTFDPSDARINFARSAALPSNPRNAAGQQVGQSWVAEAPSKLDDLIYSLQDKQIDLKKAVKAVKEQIGAIADKFDPYLQEELYHGRSAKGVKDFLDTELRPLLQEMQMRKVEMAELEEFLHMRHAEERNAQIAKVNPSMQDEGSGVSTADARAYLAGLDPAKRRAYEALAKRVDAINASTRKLLVDTGLETQDTIDAWEKTYKNYVPLQREDVEGGMGTGSGFSVRGSSTKRAMGSKRAVADILANVAMQRERAIVRAEKNRVAQALYGLAVQAPNPDYWIAVDPNNPDMVAMQQALVDLGANPIDAQNIVKEPKQRYVDPRTGLVTERINPALRSAENVVAMRVNGEDKFVFMSTKDPRAMRMAQAMKNLDADELGRALQVSAKVTRWMASVNTQYNPIFGVVNLTRDVQGALLNLSSTPLAGRQAEVAKNTLAALRGIYIDLRDRRAGKATTSAWAGLWEEFQNEGGQTGYKDMFRTSKDRAEAIEKEIRKIGEGKAKGLGRAMFEWLSDYNETMENAVRLAVYKVGKENGLSNQRAASIAKSISVNFNKKGQVATQAGALFAFFNASVQGTARIAETMKGPMGKKIAIGGMTLGAMQAVTLAAAGFDEDEPPEFVRERALIIPMGGGDYLSIPMPLGFHVLPNIGRITTEWALSGFRDTGKRIADFTGLTLDAFNPIGNAGLSLQTITPTAIDPLAALAENKDWTGKPIAMEDFNSLHPTPGHSRARDTASWISKILSYWMNAASGGTKYKPGAISWTPDQIDYFIGQASGGVGREALKVEQTVTSMFTGEELPRHKVPLVGRFYGTTEGQSAEGGKFYENLRRINEHRAEIEGRRKDRGDVSEYLADNPEARLYRMAQKYESDVSKLRKKRRELQEKGGRDGQIKLIDQRITSLMKRFNDQVRAARDAE